MKHLNKYWKNEKEFIRLKMYSLYLRDMNWSMGVYHDTSEEVEIDKKIDKFFYEKKFNMPSKCNYNLGVPKYFRKNLNRVQRYKAKRDIKRVLNNKPSRLVPRYKGAGYDYY